MTLNCEMYKILCDGEKKDVDHEIEKVTALELGNDGDIQQRDGKKRAQEDMVTDFVMILEQMMNPGQSVTSIVSAVIGLATIIVGSIYVFRLPDTAIEARKLVIVMIIYGILQIFLATAYLIACIKTSIAVYRGVKDLHQIAVGLILAFVYMVISLICMIVGIFGFYKIIALVSFVEYSDTTSALYCPQLVFYTSLTVFILHIVLVIIRCCCCK
ncbi:hypothetical protein Angca_001041 [Angiostrongylus cantonensis]|nr:hypothetical protein Angca_001041 [Angiostrongylus cantonensis]